MNNVIDLAAHRQRRILGKAAAMERHPAGKQRDPKQADHE